MANHASARKRIRQTAKRTERLKHVRTTVRTYLKRVRAAATAGKKKEAAELLAMAVRKIDGAVAKGVFHRKTGSRYISRLVTTVSKLK